MRKVIQLMAFIWMVALLGPARVEALTAEAVVQETVDAVIARINVERETLKANPGSIYDLVNELIIPHFDFISMSKWILGKKVWKGATGQQREHFVEEFKILLIRTYAKALLEYSEETINYLPTERNPDSNLVVVKTRVDQRGAKTLPIDYRMHLKGGAWKVVDVVIDGVSLVSTYRGSFASGIKRAGFDGLIDQLTERNNAKLN